MIEQFFTCPYCWEEQFKWVDGSVSEQEFIEDCEVCCNPIHFTPIRPMVKSNPFLLRLLDNKDLVFVQRYLIVSRIHLDKIA